MYINTTNFVLPLVNVNNPSVAENVNPPFSPISAPPINVPNALAPLEPVAPLLPCVPVAP